MAVPTQDCKIDMSTTAFHVKTTYACTTTKTDAKKGITKKECQPSGSTSIGLKGGVLGTQMLGGIPTLKPVKIEEPISGGDTCKDVEARVKDMFS